MAKSKPVEQIESVTVRFAGDSGDGMQLTGDRFASETALFGNDISTFPDYPAEIRAPAGSLPGVSGFQVHFADHDILTPGDAPNVLVAMNPAALKTNIKDLVKGGTLIVNSDAFVDRNLEKAGYAANPLEDGSLDEYQLQAVPLSSMTLEALKDAGVSKREAERAKNMFALGLMSWLYHRPTEGTIAFVRDKFTSKPEIAEANVKAFQAEDEIAAIGAALGASFGGSLAVTTTSGPGVALKSETVGLAVSLELPLVICDIQRGGPSTGLPTKTEQADLLQAMYGRNGEAPVPIVAPRSPADCFDAALEACRIALTYRTPVFLLSDGYLANGAEPWRIPDVASLPDLRVPFATVPSDGSGYLPYARDPENLARPWARPGTPGLEHRIGGLEKADRTGAISYDPDNHDTMVRLRQAKVDGIARSIPAMVVEDPSGEARVLVLGWGSTYGPIGAACRQVRDAGGAVAQAHLRHLNPFPTNTGDVLGAYDRVLLPEMNLGQLASLLRARYLVDFIPYNRVRGMPF